MTPPTIFPTECQKDIKYSCGSVVRKDGNPTALDCDRVIIDPTDGNTRIPITPTDYQNTDPNDPNSGIPPGEYCVNVLATNSVDETNSP